MRALDWSLRWLDTTDCVVLHDTTTLPDSVYMARLQALPCVIELPYNDRVRAFILKYVKRSPKQVARMMRMSEYYFPLFEETLCRYDLPYELEFLPIIESALNPTARSHAGAAGEAAVVLGVVHRAVEDVVLFHVYAAVSAVAAGHAAVLRAFAGVPCGVACLDGECVCGEPGEQAQRKEGKGFGAFHNP